MQRDIRFIRKKGRIIPIRRKISNNLKAVPKEIRQEIRNSSGLAKTAKKEIALISAGAGISLGSLYGAGRLYSQSKKLRKINPARSIKINRASRYLKYFGVLGAASFAAGSLASINRKVKKKDKKSIFSNNHPIGTGLRLAGGYAFYRLGKRFEVMGKMNKSLLKRKNIKRMAKIRVEEI